MTNDPPCATGPSSSLLRVARQLFAGESERAAFVHALCHPRPYQTAVLWLRGPPADLPFAVAERPAWLSPDVDLAAPGERPGQHECHEAGAYYCLDLSSVFAAIVLRQLDSPLPLVIDVCAAPGGKSISAWRWLAPSLLVANEVIGKRTAALIANLKRCRVHPAIVTSADPSVLARHCPDSASLVLVDAPCSGQSLVARGKAAPGCFHPATINLNANRQRRILAHASSLVAPGGHLAYFTCTYSEKENEANLHWLLRLRPDLHAVFVPALAAHQSHLTDIPCYRLWPHDGPGAGAFTALLARDGEPDAIPAAIQSLRAVWRSGSA